MSSNAKPSAKPHMKMPPPKMPLRGVKPAPKGEPTRAASLKETAAASTREAKESILTYAQGIRERLIAYLDQTCKHCGAPHYVTHVAAFAGIDSSGLWRFVRIPSSVMILDSLKRLDAVLAVRGF